MAYVPCEWYYENILGDSCDNRCDECFGEKMFIFVKRILKWLDICLRRLKSKKGSWWYLKFINNDHVLLFNTNHHELNLKRDLFDLYFENFVYTESEE